LPQCRERWFNHLDPALKKGGWTDEEDAILVEAQAKWGNSWTKIAKLLPGRYAAPPPVASSLLAPGRPAACGLISTACALRSENAVKNRWNSATRRRAKAASRALALEGNKAFKHEAGKLCLPYKPKGKEGKGGFGIDSKDGSDADGDDDDCDDDVPKRALLGECMSGADKLGKSSGS
jgi:hypothetical protein